MVTVTNLPAHPAAVRAMEEAITLVRALSGGGAPVTFDGEFYQVRAIGPAPVPAPPVWTGSVGPKSLAVTGRLADGWVPGRAADWLRPDYIAARRLVDAAPRRPAARIWSADIWLSDAQPNFLRASAAPCPSAASLP